MRICLSLALLVPSLLAAQKEFPKLWEAKFSVDPKWVEQTPDLDHVLGGDMTALEMLDGSTGKPLWKYVFKEKHGVKQCHDWFARHATGTVEVIIQKEKSGPKEVFHLDYRTGTVVAQDQLAARTKEERTKPARKAMAGKRINHTTCRDEASGTTISVAYDDKKVKNAMGGSDLNIVVTATGGHSWKSEFTGKVVAHMVYDMLPADDGEVILDVSTAHGKVFVVYEGITCLDLATGQVLWKTTFDNTRTSVGLKAKQEIGRAAMPLAAVDGVYVADLSKGERTIKKLDPNTGAVIWKADKLKDDDIVSELLLDGGNLVARFGGVVRHEIFVPSSSGGVGDGTYKVEHTFEGNTSLRAYDALTGKPVWNTDRMDLPDNFKKGECNIVRTPGGILACGEKNLYTFDPATGKVLAQGDYNSKTIGKARRLYPYDGDFLIEGEKGIARIGTGLKPIYATNTGQCLYTEMRGDAFIVWTGKKPDDLDEFIRFDPGTGAILGKLSGCRRPRFDLSGDRFLRYDLPKVMMYRTN